MAHVSSRAAGEVVQISGATNGYVAAGEQVLGGKRAFADVLSNGDTVIYLAHNLRGDFEYGLGTWASATKTLARTAVIDSSNSGSAVAWGNPAGGGDQVFLTSVRAEPAAAASAYTITKLSAAGRSLAADEATAANVSKVLATLIADLIEAGVLRGTVSAQ